MNLCYVTGNEKSIVSINVWIQSNDIERSLFPFEMWPIVTRFTNITEKFCRYLQASHGAAKPYSFRSVHITDKSIPSCIQQREISPSTSSVSTLSFTQERDSLHTEWGTFQPAHGIAETQAILCLGRVFHVQLWRDVICISLLPWKWQNSSRKCQRLQNAVRFNYSIRRETWQDKTRGTQPILY